MFRGLAFVGSVAAVLSFFSPPALAATTPKPLKLVDSSLSISAPLSGGSTCDVGSQLFCGSVDVTTTFSGLNGRARPDSSYPAIGTLTGTTHVTRVYGCQSVATGERLRAFDVKVKTVDTINTRRGRPIIVPADGDTFTVTTYAFLLDAQPHNCPAGTTPMLYSISAKKVQLELKSTRAPIPSASYSIKGKASWTGAAPTPGAAA